MVIEGETWVREKEGQGRWRQRTQYPSLVAAIYGHPRLLPATLSTQVRAGTQGSAFGVLLRGAWGVHFESPPYSLSYSRIVG